MFPRRSTRTAQAPSASVQSSPAKDRARRAEDDEAISVKDTSKDAQRNIRAASVESSTSTTNGRTRKGGKAGLKAEHDLPAVSEEPEKRRRSRIDPKSPGVASNISGTTARTSNSTSELADMNSDDMLDKLPDLYDHSSRILDLCAPRNMSGATFDALVQHIGTAGSRSWKNFKKYKQSLDDTLATYSTERYINISLALKALLGASHTEEVGEGFWRPDEILFRANLASTVEELISGTADDRLDGLRFEKLDRDFPERFLNRFSASANPLVSGASMLLMESFDTGIELRTQFAIHALGELSAQPSFDPGNVVRQTFFQTIDGPLRGWNVHGLQSGNLTNAQKDAILLRIGEMEAIIQNNENASIPSVLQKKYPILRFVRHFIAWARVRDDEIIDRLKFLDQGQGVGHGAQGALDNEIGRRKASSTGENPTEKGYVALDYQPSSDPAQSESSDSAQLSGIIRKGPSTPKYNYRNLVQHVLKRSSLNKSASPNSTTPPVSVLQTNKSPYPSIGNNTVESAAPSASTVPETTLQLEPVRPAEAPSSARPPPIQSIQSPLGLADEGTGEVDPDVGLTPMEDEISAPQPAYTATQMPPKHEREDIIALQRAMERDQDKENDPPSAQESRIAKGRIFERQQDAERVEFDSQSSRHASGSLQANEEDDMSDPSEDEDFEQDTRAPKPQFPMRQRKRSAPTTEEASSPKRVRIAQPESSARSTSAGPSQLPVSSIPTSSQTYKRVNDRAKSLTTAITRRKPIQTRTPWSELEINTLIELIEEHGCSWALLKSKDEGGGKVFQLRDQVALKDKARNMKFDYLKAGIDMPMNFEYIALNRYQKERLREHGVEPED